LAASISKHANSFLSIFVRLLLKKRARSSYSLIVENPQFLITENRRLRQGVFPLKKGEKSQED
jgi:hypothetical protein